MKNIRIKYTILIFLIAVSFVLKSDIIPENSHSVERSVVITNCDDYDDIQLIGYISGPMVPDESFYAIAENQQLTKGYKFNTLHICGIRKTTLESIGGIGNLTEDLILSGTTPQKILSSTPYYVNNSSSLVKDELFYQAVKTSGDKLKVELKKRVLTFDDDTKTINY